MGLACGLFTSPGPPAVQHYLEHYDSKEVLDAEGRVLGSEQGEYVPELVAWEEHVVSASRLVAWKEEVMLAAGVSRRPCWVLEV
jgi:hypothetical protein